MLTGPMIKRRSNAKTAYGLMSDIRAYILEEPKRIYMGDWIIEGKEDIEDIFETKAPACGTVGCIAGNAVLLTARGSTAYQGSIERRALEILTDDDDYELRTSLGNLFLDTDVSAAYGTKKYARIVAKRIAEFQERHKAELQKVRI